MSSETASEEMVKKSKAVAVLLPSTNPKVKFIGKPLKARQVYAASLIAAGKLKMEEVAAKAGIAYITLWTWQQKPKFKEEVERQQAIFNARVAGSFIGQRVKRVEQRDKIYQSLQHIRRQRAQSAIKAKDQELIEQGGLTGLILPRLRKVGHKIVREFEPDHATVDQMRNLMREQAIDVGQWSEKKDVGGSVELVVKRVIGVSEDDV
jgi:hypothetical protein